MRLSHIESLDDESRQKLNGAGIRSPEALLENCSTPRARHAVARRTGLSEASLLRWLNNADLFRIRGIGQEYADLLETVGVDTVPELAQRRADHLFQKMADANREKKIVRRLPTQEQVRDWIMQAKELPRMISY